MISKENRTKDAVIFSILAIHFGVVAVYSLLTSHFHILIPGLVAIAAARLAFQFKPGTLLSRSVMALSLVLFSTILIHISDGLIEMHFHIFVALVLISIYYDWRVIVIMAGFVAVHHLVGLVTTFYQVYAPNPNLYIYSLHVIFVVLESAVLIYICQISVKRLKTINQQNQKLQEAFDEVENKRQTGHKVSTHLNLVTSELNATTNLQFSRSQQHAAAMQEVSASLSQVGKTAQEIALNTRQVAKSANQVLNNAEKVQAVAQNAALATSQGLAAVEGSNEAIEEVKIGIGKLTTQLATLSQDSQQISSIVGLIRELADQTHLLALNAAIESVGAGKHGERFAVIAKEVKQLSDRSLGAVVEIRKVINTLQEAVANAVNESQLTDATTSQAVERSHQAGQAISRIKEVVTETTDNSSQIVIAIQEVFNLTEEIKLATQQQDYSIQQVVSTMETIGMVARENAQSVSQVCDSVAQIDHLSSELNQAISQAA